MGQTPWSARVPLDPLFAYWIKHVAHAVAVDLWTLAVKAGGIYFSFTRSRETGEEMHFLLAILAH